MSAVFEVRNMSFDYPGGRPSLSDVTFDIQPGERVALVGANGTGKSTLLHLLDGLYFPSSGTISAFGTAMTESALDGSPFGRDFRRQVGYLFQNSDAQLFCPTVEEEIAFGPLQLGLSRDEICCRIDETLELLEIPDLRERVPQNLSEGEKKQVALASLLVVGPSVLLLDEPTSGLDPRSQSVLLEILEQLHDAGLTLITATHDLTLLPHLADRALVLDESHHLAADVTLDALLDDTDFLLDVNLIHVHSHRHGRLVHKHAHYHITGHEHEH